MPNHHFISYSRIEAKDFALRLSDDLTIGEPQVQIWLDVRDIPAGVNWDDAIDEAIKTCETLIFIMTPDSVRAESQCKNEWAWALRYKKPVVPLLCDPSAEAPFRLYSRQRIDCTGDCLPPCFTLSMIRSCERVSNILPMATSPQESSSASCTGGQI